MRREKGTLWEDRLLRALVGLLCGGEAAGELLGGSPSQDLTQFRRAASGEHGARLPSSLGSGEEGRASSWAAELCYWTCRMALKLGPRKEKPVSRSDVLEPSATRSGCCCTGEQGLPVWGGVVPLSKHWKISLAKLSL